MTLDSQNAYRVTANLGAQRSAHVSTSNLYTFSSLLITGNREQAFVYGLSSACLVHSIAKACSSGLSSRCHCAPASGSVTDLLPPPAGYRWGGCADDVKFASSFGEQFTDRVWKRRRVTIRTAANLHNTIAGRTVIMHQILISN